MFDSCFSEDTDDIQNRLQNGELEANHHDDDKEESDTGRVHQIRLKPGRPTQHPQAGRCLPKDTCIWTDRGLETIEEIFARADQKASCTSRKTDVSTTPISAVNHKANLEQVSRLTHNGRRKIYEVTLSSGRILKATARHPIKIINDQGWLVWKNVEDLDLNGYVNGYVASALFGALAGRSGSSGLAPEEAEFLGYLVSDGTVTETHRVAHSNTGDDVRERFGELARDLFGIRVRVYDEKDSHLNSKAVREKLAEEYGLDYVKAEGKTVPRCVRNAKPHVQKRFLAAYFDGDGHFAPDGSGEVTSASEELIRGVQLMLLGFGIPCTRSPKYVCGYDHEYWRIHLSSESVDRFIDEIGVLSNRRSRQIQSRSSSSRGAIAKQIPNLSGLIEAFRDAVRGNRKFNRIADSYFGTDPADCSPDVLRRIVDWASDKHLPRPARGIVTYFRFLMRGNHTFEKIESIEEIGKEPTFNLVLPRTHSFLSNGMISHYSVTDR